MLEMIKGCKISSAERLEEQYETKENFMIANVNTSKIENIVLQYINKQNSLLFFILELPTNKEEETTLRKDNLSPMHKAIYYIDGLNSKKAIELLKAYGELLINDGLSCFGFGAQDNMSEIMVEKYNVVKLWSNTIEKYLDLFEANDIHKTDNLVTAWDTFNDQTPGESFIFEKNGKNVYSLIEELKEWEIYFAEYRQE